MPEVYWQRFRNVRREHQTNVEFVQLNCCGSALEVGKEKEKREERKKT